MKKIIILLLLICTIGCTKKPINYMKAKWTLDESIKPTVEFDRSVKNSKNGIFYVDKQIEFSTFLQYIKLLNEKGFEVDWKYSDIDTIEKLEQAYSNKGKEFDDGYINFRMCKDDLCFFMQWVNKEKYNTLNASKPNSYSFKLETESKTIKSN